MRTGKDDRQNLRYAFSPRLLRVFFRRCILRLVRGAIVGFVVDCRRVVKENGWVIGGGDRLIVLT